MDDDIPQRLAAYLERYGVRQIDLLPDSARAVEVPVRSQRKPGWDRKWAQSMAERGLL
ncbi:MAG: hypothetical protein ACRDY2_03705 [Acidimicrobiales bacterium]